ncbi:hypothetical protein [Vulcanisaeta distributa]|uniref:hypothetical protein n=1 Tax=Vulcanisaeta distributa TaxID=164451 RepID=UPI0006D1464A|nr:hypothetical protein [Vulcanisaeta distributa]
MGMAMSYMTRFWTLFIINLVISFALAYMGYWLLMAVLGLIIGYVLNANKASSALTCTGVSGLIGVLVVIFMNPYAIYDGEVTAAIIGLPYSIIGSITLLIITLLVALALSSLGGLIGHYLRMLIRH